MVILGQPFCNLVTRLHEQTPVFVTTDPGRGGHPELVFDDSLQLLLVERVPVLLSTRTLWGLAGGFP